MNRLTAKQLVAELEKMKQTILDSRDGSVDSDYFFTRAAGKIDDAIDEVKDSQQFEEGR